VHDWRRFYQMMLLAKDQPQVARKMLENQGEFNAGVTERASRDVQVEAAVFSEPIGDNNRPLISPRTYRELVLPTYQPVLDGLHEDKESIRRELEQKVPRLLKQGGYAPLLDDRARAVYPGATSTSGDRPLRTRRASHSPSQNNPARTNTAT
jgi:hypothetical protein